MRSYETDYAGWVEDTARAIVESRWSDIDRAMLAEEVLDLRKRIENQMESRLRVLFVHLLKARYQPEKHSRSWDLTIAEQRHQAARILRDNPSLKSSMDKMLSDAYEDARYEASRQTDLELITFPEDSPFTRAEIWGE